MVIAAENRLQALLINRFTNHFSIQGSDANETQEQDMTFVYFSGRMSIKKGQAILPGVLRLNREARRGIDNLTEECITLT